MCHHLVWKFSFAISRVIQHPAIVPQHWLLSHSTTYFLIMTSPSKSGLKMSSCHIPKPHVFETFDPAEDYESFQRHIILPIICDSHDSQSIHYTQKPTLPPLIVFAPDQRSLKSVYQLILHTDINLTNFTPFVHYGSYPPHQSASIPIPRCFSAHGYFSPNIPGCWL